MVRKTFGLMAMAAALAVVAAPAWAQEHDAGASARLVTTMGQAVVTRAPDQAWVTVGIEARAQRPQDAQRQAAQVMNAIQKALASLGIAESAIRTVSFDLQADWDHSNNKRTLKGYVLTNRVEVRVDDIANVGPVLDQSIAAGGNTIHGVRWDIKDRDAAEREGLRQAIADAKARAEVAVTAAGGRLGRVARIDEQRQDMPRPMPMMRVAAMQEAVDMATPISPGEIEIRSTVTVSFRIE